MARLGVGLLVIPQKPWEAVKADFEQYHSVWRDVNSDQPIPKPLCGGFFFVDENEDRAQELGMKYVSDYYHTAMRHYEMTAEHFGKAKGYEFYSNVGKYIERQGEQNAAEDFAKLMPIGTPSQVLDQCRFIRDTIDNQAFMVQTSYAGMPWREAERNMRCFAEHCLPELQRWEAEPLAAVAELDASVGG
jgi:alkanesulfonate monooxygenase SsuD/methylene tetrahydromethanopterin reductase-like flavin-dependent oxidoreductase (luciferase family)